jgi:hypothetical protein
MTGSVQQRHQAMLRLKLWTTNMYRYLNNQSNTDRQSANQIFDRDEGVPLANTYQVRYRGAHLVLTHVHGDAAISLLLSFI